MGAGHDHGLSTLRHEKPLRWALLLTATFLLIELIGGWLSNSLALLSDAAHMGTDTIALGIALTALRMSQRPADAKRSFGYARMEALGAMANGALLFLVAAFILWEAVGRFLQPPQVLSEAMFLIALAGLAVNLVAMRLLRAGSGDNLNMKGAYLEVWSDMLASIGVLLGALLIGWTGWLIIDPILAVLIGLWVLPRTWILLRDAGHVLMEGVPKDVDMGQLRALFESEPSVRSLHELHVWSLGTRQRALTVHLVLAEGADQHALRERLVASLRDQFHIDQATLQVEVEDCKPPIASTVEPDGHCH